VGENSKGRLLIGYHPPPIDIQIAMDRRAKVDQADAGGAAGIAGAFGDELAAHGEQVFDLVVALFGETEAAGVAVVHKDGGAAGLAALDLAADVALIAHGQHGQRDHHEVADAHESFDGLEARVGDRVENLRGDHQPEGRGGQGLRRQVKLAVPRFSMV